MQRRQFLSLLLLLVPSAAAQAQLVSVDKTFRVVRTDTLQNRIEVSPVDGGNTQTYILVNGYTRVTKQGQSVDWKDIPAGTIINVHGALTWDMKVKAQKIWYLD
ncbi:MAG: hypothetical protein ACYCW6_22605 [Candidatus Xenobia bacterium]